MEQHTERVRLLHPPAMAKTGKARTLWPKGNLWKTVRSGRGCGGRDPARKGGVLSPLTSHTTCVPSLLNGHYFQYSAKELERDF